MWCLKEGQNERCVCPGRERGGRTGGEPASACDFPASQPCDPIRPACARRALAESQQALKTAQAIEDANERRRALELAARDARYFAERVASAVPQPEPADAVVVAFGSRITILRDDGRRQTFRIVGEDEANPRCGSIAYVSPLAHHLIGKQVGEAVAMAGHEIEIVAVE
jgi:transcription elongation GreA/GreB family factor